MTLNGVMAVTLRYFTEFGKLTLQKTICAEFMLESIVFLVRVQCRRKESSRSLSHLLMSFLLCLLDSKTPSRRIIYALFLQRVVGFWRLCPQTPTGLHPWTLLGLVPRPLICRPLEKIPRAPMSMLWQLRIAWQFPEVHRWVSLVVNME